MKCRIYLDAELATIVTGTAGAGLPRLHAAAQRRRVQLKLQQQPAQRPRHAPHDRRLPRELRDGPGLAGPRLRPHGAGARRRARPALFASQSVRRALF